MTKADKLAMVRIMADCDDADDVLSAYLDLAAEKIINRAYPYEAEEHTRVPFQYEGLQIEIAVYLLNKRGAEGQTEHIENGIHRHYGGADIPAEMLSQIVPFCGVVK